MTAAAAIAAKIDFPGFPMTRFPRWFDFSQSNHHCNEIVNKVSELSARTGQNRRSKAIIVDNSSGAAGLVPALPTHEIEVATFVGLQNRLVEQVRVAAPGPFGRNRRCKRRAALRKLRRVDQEIDAALRDIEADHVAVPEQRQRTAHGGFRRDM